MLQVSGNTLLQLERFKHRGVVFTSDANRNKDIDIRVGKASAILREFYRSVVPDRELSNATKLSVFKSVFVSFLIYAYEYWVMTEKTLSQMQTAEMGFLWRVRGVTLLDKVELTCLLPSWSGSSRTIWDCCWPWGISWGLDFCWPWGIFVLQGLLPRDPTQRKSGHENQWIQTEYLSFLFGILLSRVVQASPVAPSCLKEQGKVPHDVYLQPKLRSHFFAGSFVYKSSLLQCCANIRALVNLSCKLLCVSISFFFLFQLMMFSHCESVCDANVKWELQLV